jgi:hypothetical protein
MPKRIALFAVIIFSLFASCSPLIEASHSPNQDCSTFPIRFSFPNSCNVEPGAK